MGEFVNLKDKVKKHFRFSPAEIRAIAATILVIAFIISFAEWGEGSAVDVSAGAVNLINAIIVTALTILFRVTVQRIASLHIGYRLEYRIWTWGLLLGIAMVIITRGNLWIVIPATFIVHHMAGERIGWFRYGLNYFAIGMIGLWGPIANMALAMFFKVIDSVISNPLTEKAILLNVVMALITMMPIPPLDGSKLFWGSRMAYSFCFVFVAAGSLLFLSDLPVFLSVAAALVLAMVGWLLYYIYLERWIWAGPGGGKMVK